MVHVMQKACRAALMRLVTGRTGQPRTERDGKGRKRRHLVGGGGRAQTTRREARVTARNCLCNGVLTRRTRGSRPRTAADGEGVSDGRGTTLRKMFRGERPMVVVGRLGTPLDGWVVVYCYPNVGMGYRKRAVSLLKVTRVPRCEPGGDVIVDDGIQPPFPEDPVVAETGGRGSKRRT